VATLRAGRFAGASSQEIYFMGINKDQVEGRVKEAVGKVQETAGKAVHSQQQQAKGLAKEVAGAAQKTYGDAKEEVKSHVKEQQKQG
jgi:uncharacterized protein YjbJ (UPF0337 family)